MIAHILAALKRRQQNPATAQQANAWASRAQAAFVKTFRLKPRGK